MLELLYTDYTFRIVMAGSALLGIISGILGSFAVLRKQSLLGDGVSHAALPGVVMAFLLTGSKKTEVLLFGALITGVLCTGLILLSVSYSKVKFDSVLALMMSSFFGFGLVLLTYVQKMPDANQAGLNRFIYGQASTMLWRDLMMIIVCGSILLVSIVGFWKELKLFVFDSAFAGSIGLPVRKLNLFLSILLVMGIIIGLQTVGVVLMSAMLIAPAVAARQWSNCLWKMTSLSAFFGALSGVIGTTLSSKIPNLPTGPIIVVCITLIAILSLFLAPGRGIVFRLCKKIIYKKGRGDTDVTSN